MIVRKKAVEKTFGVGGNSIKVRFPRVHSVFHIGIIFIGGSFRETHETNAQAILFTGKNDGVLILTHTHILKLIVAFVTHTIASRVGKSVEDRVVSIKRKHQ